MVAPRDIATYRVIDGLRLCTLLDQRPSCIPRPGGKGSKALGRTYEKKIGKLVKRTYPDLISGQWFEYYDNNGRGYCQIDHYLVFNEQVLVLECKLTQTSVAWGQMHELYKPVLEHMYKRPVTCVQVCKHVVDRTPTISELSEALAKPGSYFLWHRLA